MNTYHIGKNETFDLSGEHPGLRNIIVAAGWNVDTFEGREAADVDLSCFLLNPMGQTRMDEDFIFYNNLEAEGGAAAHRGDNKTGAGAGDDEIIFLRLSEIDFEIASIVFVASIYEGPEKGQDFSMVKDAYLRIYDEDNKEELIRFDLADEFAGHHAVKIAALERMGNQWSFRSIGEPAAGGLAGIAQEYGLLIAGTV